MLELGIWKLLLVLRILVSHAVSLQVLESGISQTDMRLITAGRA